MVTLFKITGELNIIHETMRDQNTNPKLFYFYAVTDFETRCKPRVAGHQPQHLDYMVQVLYVYDPGSHRMTSVKILTEQIIIYKTIRGQNTRQIYFHFYTMAAFYTNCKPKVAGPGPQPLDYMTQVLYVSNNSLSTMAGQTTK